MTSRRRPETYRVTGVPPNLTVEDLKAALSERLPYEHEDYIQINADIIPSCIQSTTKMALISFIPHPPVYLESLSNGSDEIYTLRTRKCGQLVIDKHMHGLTQLYGTKPGQTITADIVAVHGLDGHAYRSWQADDEFPPMWLRDFLAEDFPSCRTMVYGYHSELEGSRDQQIVDCTRVFLEEMVRARKTPEEIMRPLILIGHGFGGIILSQSLVKSMEAYFHEDTIQHSLCLATRAIFFFGTPFRERFDENEDRYVQSATLLESIGKNSMEEFLRVVRRFKYKIFNFYQQLLPVRRVTEGIDSSSRRTSASHVAVDSGFGLLNLDGLEKSIPVNADHSSIVKFGTKYLQPYTQVAHYLRKILEDISGKQSERILENRKLIQECYHSVLDERNEEIAKLELQLSELATKFDEEQQRQQVKSDAWEKKYGDLREDHMKLVKDYAQVVQYAKSFEQRCFKLHDSYQALVDRTGTVEENTPSGKIETAT